MTSTIVARALEMGAPVRLHMRDGEVLVAHILACDADEIRFSVVHSSRPERYGVCDSTGFRRGWDELERAVLLSAGKER